MTGIDNVENRQPQTIDQIIQERQVWLQDAVEIVAGDRTANPLEVFSEPTLVRQDAEALPLSEETENKLRRAAGQFEIGAAHDQLARADHQLLEGGLAWKIAAEAAICTAEKTMIFAGSPYRKIDDAEKEFMTRSGFAGDDEVGETEYDIARQIAQGQAGYTPYEEEITLPFGYELEQGAELTQEPTGQLIQIGERDGRAVLLLRVDQDSPEPPFNRPDSAALLCFVADTLQASGDEDSSIGIITTNTYPSRGIDALRAGIKHPDRSFNLGMVGRATMAAIKNEELKPADINQIPGELHAIATKLKQLDSEFHNL